MRIFGPNQYSVSNPAIRVSPLAPSWCSIPKPAWCSTSSSRTTGSGRSTNDCPSRAKSSALSGLFDLGRGRADPDGGMASLRYSLRPCRRPRRVVDRRQLIAARVRVGAPDGMDGPIVKLRRPRIGGGLFTLLDDLKNDRVTADDNLQDSRLYPEQLGRPLWPRRPVSFRSSRSRDSTVFAVRQLTATK